MTIHYTPAVGTKQKDESLKKNIENLVTRAHLLTGVPSPRSIFAELAFKVINCDNLHHNAALCLFFQIEVPSGSGVGPIELVPLESESCKVNVKNVDCQYKVIVLNTTNSVF